MKIAIVGKGGVGKTTLTSLLAYHYAKAGRPVLAIDADPSPCLGGALGFSEERLRDLVPVADMGDLIAERTGSTEKSAVGVFFKLNPRVSDLPDRFSVTEHGIRLLLLGAVKEGGSGCICPASALLKQLVRHILLERDEIVLLDLYAGVEHLGRGTADSVDVMVIVAEPSRRSVQAARQIRSLAKDIGITNLLLVGNKVSGPDDIQFFKDQAGDLPLIGLMPVASGASEADRRGEALYSVSSESARSVASIAARIEGSVAYPGVESQFA